MPWSQRGKKQYFYRSVKVNGRTRNQYLGRGPEAQQLAAELGQRHGQRLREAAEALLERWRHDPALRAVVDFYDLTAILLQGALVSAGYHLVNGVWRYRRARNNESALPEDVQPGIESPPEARPGGGPDGPAAGPAGLHG